jgi:hypothetical protein
MRVCVCVCVFMCVCENLAQILDQVGPTRLREREKERKTRAGEIEKDRKTERQKDRKTE